MNVGWTASTGDLAVSRYDIERDGTPVGSADAAATSFVDGSVLADSTYSYTVRAVDVSGNASSWSAPVSVTTPAAQIPIFTDGFESGDLSAWSSSGGLAIESSDVRTGTYAAAATTTNGNTYARKTLDATYSDAYARLGFQILSQANQVICCGCATRRAARSATST